MIELERLVAGLSSTRPVFHSEADFQHALAWAIHTAYPDVEVRLEYRASYTPDRVHLDLFLKKGDWVGIIELKYKTKPLTVTVLGEKFDLQDHGAEPLGRYDFLKDLERVEEALCHYPDGTGWVVMVTNDSQYWNPPGSTEVADFAFRIHQGRTLQPGQLTWRPGAENGVAQGRERPLSVAGNYLISWKDYSTLREGARGLMRSLVLKVNRPSHEAVARPEMATIIPHSPATPRTTSGLTVAESIFLAASAIVRRGQTTFTRQDVLRTLETERAVHAPTFNPTFQGMRTDPGLAPLPAPPFRGVFQRIGRGEYQLSEAGLQLAGQLDGDDSN